MKTDHESCDNCQKVHEKVYSNDCKSCFGVVLKPHRKCDVIRSCVSFDDGRMSCTDVSLDEASVMALGYLSAVNEYIDGSFVRSCEGCVQEETCYAQSEPEDRG
jgi:hypothetical protein